MSYQMWRAPHGLMTVVYVLIVKYALRHHHLLVLVVVNVTKKQTPERVHKLHKLIV
jgi:hypothetical protein